MEKEYSKVPNIISTKDVDYLKDMFGWFINSFKVLDDSVQCIEDEAIINLINDFNDYTYDLLDEIIAVLEEGENNE